MIHISKARGTLYSCCLARNFVESLWSIVLGHFDASAILGKSVRYEGSLTGSYVPKNIPTSGHSSQASCQQALHHAKTLRTRTLAQPSPCYAMGQAVWVGTDGPAPGQTKVIRVCEWLYEVQCNV